MIHILYSAPSERCAIVFVDCVYKPVILFTASFRLPEGKEPNAPEHLLTISLRYAFISSTKTAFVSSTSSFSIATTSFKQSLGMPLASPERRVRTGISRWYVLPSLTPAVPWGVVMTMSVPRRVHDQPSREKQPSQVTALRRVEI